MRIKQQDINIWKCIKWMKWCMLGHLNEAYVILLLYQLRGAEKDKLVQSNYEICRCKTNKGCCTISLQCGKTNQAFKTLKLKWIKPVSDVRNKHLQLNSHLENKIKGFKPCYVITTHQTFFIWSHKRKSHRCLRSDNHTCMNPVWKHWNKQKHNTSINKI